MESYDEVDLESLDIEEVKDIVYRLRYQQVTRDVVPAAKRHAIESRLRYCAAQPPAFILSNVLLFVHLDGQDDYLAALRIILQVHDARELPSLRQLMQFPVDSENPMPFYLTDYEGFRGPESSYLYTFYSRKRVIPVTLFEFLEEITALAGWDIIRWLEGHQL